MKHARSGDTVIKVANTTAAITSSTSSSSSSSSSLSVPPPSIGGNPAISRSVASLEGIHVPESVYYCAVESDSIQQQAYLETALQCMIREDPSLSIINNEETGQLLIRGMGELHLDIIRSRLLNDFKVKATFGSPSVSYRESILSTLTLENYVYKRISFLSTGNSTTDDDNTQVAISIELNPVEQGQGLIIEVHDYINQEVCQAPDFVYDMDEEDEDNNRAFTYLQRKQMENGIRDALLRGPLLGYACTDMYVKIYNINCISCAAASVNPIYLRAAASRGVSTLLRSTLMPNSSTANSCVLLEPFMYVSIICPSNQVGIILSDLTSKRRGTILEVFSLSHDISRSCIESEVPLIEMMGYSTAIRSATQGLANFSMRFHSFRQIPAHLQKTILDK